jgi:polar amino acid transport system substrate-binding protein
MRSITVTLPAMAVPLVLAAAGMLACLPAAASGQLTVPILAQESVAPKWIPGQAKPQGICADVLAAIENIDPRIRFVGHDRARSLAVIEDSLARGTVWGACALVDSPVRKHIAARVSVPLYEARYRLAAAAGDTEAVASLDDLARRKPLVNTPRGSGYIAELKSRGLEIDDSTGDSLTNLRKTIHGHGRYTYLNEPSMMYYIRTAGLEHKLTVLPAVFNPSYTYFWVSKRADPALAPAIEAALAKLKASGELARIYNRWTSLR